MSEQQASLIDCPTTVAISTMIWPDEAHNCPLQAPRFLKRMCDHHSENQA
jgi:hypothetical protein